MSDTPNDKVNHPSHYGDPDSPYETIKIIEAAGFGEGFVMGNALKYQLRAGKKEGESEADDLRKCLWYVSRRLWQIEQEGKAK